MLEKLEKKSIGKKSRNKSCALLIDVKVYYKNGLGFNCPFCFGCGRKKFYPDLRRLKYHFTYTHNSDIYCQRIIFDLEDQLRRGVLS